jgi:hypothetical protein
LLVKSFGLLTSSLEGHTGYVDTGVYLSSNRS